MRVRFKWVLMMPLLVLLMAGCQSKVTKTSTLKKVVAEKVTKKPEITWHHVKGNPKVPILMYHSISPSTNSLRIPANQFKQQMKWLKERKYYTLTPADAERVFLKHEVPNRPYVWLTFDDGYEDNFKVVYPTIVREKMNATINFITSFSKHKGHLTTEQAQTMLDSKHIAIESHTVKHQDLDVLNEQQQTRELMDSKRWLDKTFSQQTDIICYPAGRANEFTANVAKKAGYKLGLTTQPGLGDLNDGPYNLKRVRMVPNMSKKQYFNLIKNGE
ncbi:polysaccharide deacetylase family protein [Pediococcus argentinicus]|uniref:polysaccharide deacetylase family protein n=1 Tax=Pediococcus argentinicus TaxID=480391 RepID=UPI00338EDFAE